MCTRDKKVVEIFLKKYSIETHCLFSRKIILKVKQKKLLGDCLLQWLVNCKQIFLLTK